MLLKVNAMNNNLVDYLNNLFEILLFSLNLHIFIIL